MLSIFSNNLDLFLEIMPAVKEEIMRRYYVGNRDREVDYLDGRDSDDVNGCYQEASEITDVSRQLMDEMESFLGTMNPIS